MVKNEDIRKRLQSVKCFALDMDGTFYLGDRILEGSMAFIRKVKATGRRFIFLTNNSSKGSWQYVDKLADMGVMIDKNEILTSGQVAAEYVLKSYPGKKVFLLGNDNLRKEMEAMGVVLNDDAPNLCVIGFDTTLDYGKMCRVCDYVRAGLPFVATHPDFNCPTETGFIPDIGAILAFIEASTGRRPDRIVGKPYEEIVDCLKARTGLESGQMAMVGDRLYTDIRTGVDHGLLAILVLSGETKAEDLKQSEIQPGLVFENLGEMVPYL